MNSYIIWIFSLCLFARCHLTTATKRSVRSVFYNRFTELCGQSPTDPTALCVSYPICLASGGSLDERNTPCSSSIGFCCRYHHQCGDTLRAPVGYWHSENYPAYSSKNGPCEIIISPMEETCYVRIEFIDTVLSSPAADRCSSNTLTIYSQSQGEGSLLCGSLTNYQTYVSVEKRSDGSSKDIKLLMTIKDKDFKYRIKFTQIRCDQISKFYSVRDDKYFAKISAGNDTEIQTNSSPNDPKPNPTAGTTAPSFSNSVYNLSKPNRLTDTKTNIKFVSTPLASSSNISKPNQSIDSTTESNSISPITNVNPQQVVNSTTEFNADVSSITASLSNSHIANPTTEFSTYVSPITIPISYTPKLNAKLEFNTNSPPNTTKQKPIRTNNKILFPDVQNKKPNLINSIKSPNLSSISLGGIKFILANTEDGDKPKVLKFLSHLMRSNSTMKSKRKGKSYEKQQNEALIKIYFDFLRKSLLSQVLDGKNVSDFNNSKIIDGVVISNTSEIENNPNLKELLDIFVKEFSSVETDDNINNDNQKFLHEYVDPITNYDDLDQQVDHANNDYYTNYYVYENEVNEDNHEYHNENNINNYIHINHLNIYHHNDIENTYNGNEHISENIDKEYLNSSIPFDEDNSIENNNELENLNNINRKDDENFNRVDINNEEQSKIMDYLDSFSITTNPSNQNNILHSHDMNKYNYIEISIPNENINNGKDTIENEIIESWISDYYDEKVSSSNDQMNSHSSHKNYSIGVTSDSDEHYVALDDSIYFTSGLLIKPLSHDDIYEYTEVVEEPDDGFEESITPVPQVDSLLIKGQSSDDYQQFFLKKPVDNADVLLQFVLFNGKQPADIEHFLSSIVSNNTSGPIFWLNIPKQPNVALTSYNTEDLYKLLHDLLNNNESLNLSDLNSDMQQKFTEPITDVVEKLNMPIPDEIIQIKVENSDTYQTKTTDLVSKDDIQTTTPDLVTKGDIQTNSPDFFTKGDIQTTTPDLVTKGDIQTTTPDLVTKGDIQTTTPDLVTKGDIQTNTPDIFTKGDIQTTTPDLVTKGDIQTTTPDLVTNGDIETTTPDLVTKGDIQTTTPDLVTKGDIQTATSDLLNKGDMQTITTDFVIETVISSTTPDIVKEINIPATTTPDLITNDTLKSTISDLVTKVDIQTIINLITNNYIVKQTTNDLKIKANIQATNSGITSTTAPETVIKSEIPPDIVIGADILTTTPGLVTTIPMLPNNSYTALYSTLLPTETPLGDQTTKTEIEDSSVTVVSDQHLPSSSSLGVVQEDNATDNDPVSAMMLNLFSTLSDHDLIKNIGEPRVANLCQAMDAKLRVNEITENPLPSVNHLAPYFGTLLIRNDMQQYFYCSGTLISDIHVITAASCVLRKGFDIDGYQLKVFFNSADPSRETPSESTSWESLWDSSFGVSVARVTFHPMTDHDSLDYNIAVLQLVQKVDIQPITFIEPTKERDLQDVLVMGHNLSNKTNIPLVESYFTSMPSYTTGKMLLNAECNNQFGSNSISYPYSGLISVKSNMFCMDLKDNYQTCEGNQGAPVITGFPNRPRLVGIVAGNLNGCTTLKRTSLAGQYPDLVTRVSAVQDFIDIVTSTVRFNVEPRNQNTINFLGTWGKK